jgi:hypothetical protein
VNDHLAIFTNPQLPTGAWTPCREEPDAWFPQPRTDYLAGKWAARQCASRCPFRFECFTFAADPRNGVRHGIWGGLNFGRNSPDRPFINAYRAAVWPTTTKQEDAA